MLDRCLPREVGEGWVAYLGLGSLPRVRVAYLGVQGLGSEKKIGRLDGGLKES